MKRWLIADTCRLQVGDNICRLAYMAELLGMNITDDYKQIRVLLDKVEGKVQAKINEVNSTLYQKTRNESDIIGTNWFAFFKTSY